VTKTTESTEAANWSHVQSEYNPADLASRGVYLQELVDNPFQNVVTSSGALLLSEMASQTSVSLGNVRCQQGDEDHRVHRGSQLVARSIRIQSS